ncbi:MAG: methylated-DNA--[protein]-cysteine S-methyltransferase [Anaerolineae bacterium]|nr:MAG: methylated-DNA--[protein]-cysteine S-methyltransferase [Anaerolineae bacterium]
MADWMHAVLAFLEAPQRGRPAAGHPGTAYQQRVWAALRDPRRLHDQLHRAATRLGNPRASRAVASACAANTIAVAIPCHRVVARSGRLAGYRWGLTRKEMLLARGQRP